VPVRLAPAALLIALAAAGCADAPTVEGVPAPPGAPDVARITCEADGSTTVETPDVLAQRDGVHLRIDSRLDDSASMNGLGFDVDPGVSSWVSGVPGTSEVACWPFSDHGGPDPSTVELTVFDPEHWYVDGELQCTDDDDGSALDLRLVPSYEGTRSASITADEARPLIQGLLPDDEVLLPGWAGAAHHGVVVIRDGRRIADVGFASIDGRWVQHGGYVCGGMTVTP
jgi:hypothetical protein